MEIIDKPCNSTRHGDSSLLQASISGATGYLLFVTLNDPKAPMNLGKRHAVTGATTRNRSLVGLEFEPYLAFRSSGRVMLCLISEIQTALHFP